MSARDIKEQTPGTRIPIGGGIYRHKANSDDEVTYHERPILGGKRTWRALAYNFVKQTNLKFAKEDYHRRRTEVAAGRDPYEAKKTEPKLRKPTVELVITEYVKANYPDRYLKPRPDRTVESESSNCARLLAHCRTEQPWHEVEFRMLQTSRLPANSW